MIIEDYCFVLDLPIGCFTTDNGKVRVYFKSMTMFFLWYVLYIVAAIYMSGKFPMILVSVDTVLGIPN
jgi:hypothetical protein